MARSKKKTATDEVVITPMEETATEDVAKPVEEKVKEPEHVNVEIPKEERRPIIRIRYVPGITSVDCHYVEQALEKAKCSYESLNINDFKEMALADWVRTKFAVLIKDEVITNYRTALSKLKENGKI